MMNVRTICLAILQLGDATGYEIRKRVADGHFSHFVDASFGSIYPALNKMEAEGLLDARVEEQDGKPNRRVYTLTPKGGEAFHHTLSQPASPDSFKSEFLMLAMFAELMTRDDLSRAIEAQVRWLVGELDAIDETEATIDLAAASWVASCGRACLQAQLDFIYENRDALQDLARQPSLVAAE